MKFTPDTPVAFCYKPNTWPPQLSDGVRFGRGQWDTLRESYPISDFRFCDFIGKPSHWINVHTEGYKVSDGELIDYGNDILFKDDNIWPIGPFVHEQDRLVCDHWILITDLESFDSQRQAWLHQRFGQGDDSHLRQGSLGIF